MTRSDALDIIDRLPKRLHPMPKLPDKDEIREWWAKWLAVRGKFDSVHEATEDDYCFACGFKARTERAHIKASVEGGSDDVKNLHLLCPDCHRQSERLSGYEYYEWFIDQNLFSMVARGAQLACEGEWPE